MGGVSYVFREVNDVTRQKAFISADVEYVNYASASFDETDQASTGYFNDLNNTIDNQFITRRVLIWIPTIWKRLAIPTRFNLQIRASAIANFCPYFFMIFLGAATHHFTGRGWCVATAQC